MEDTQAGGNPVSSPGVVGNGPRKLVACIPKLDLRARQLLFIFLCIDFFVFMIFVTEFKNCIVEYVCGLFQATVK